MNKINKKKSITNGTLRRNFLKKALLGLTYTAFPFVQTKSKIFASTNSVKKLNLACIGIGCRGIEVIESLHKTGLCNIVALCDTDMGAEHTQKIINKFSNAKRFQDFRKMFDTMEKEIDAVAISTPDFSHFPATIHSMSLGKHVYVEKPLTHTFQEGELLMAAAKKCKSVITQMGNQGHSGSNYFQFKAWTEAGIIKDVTRINAHMNNTRRWHDLTRFGNITCIPSEDETIPETLDWDKWLSVKPFRKYNRKYTMGDWRCWYEFGNGALGDWGPHIIDTAHRFLKLGLPYEIDPIQLEAHNPFIFPLSSTISFKFPIREEMPAVEIVWYDGIKNFPKIPDNFNGVVTESDFQAPSNSASEKVKFPPGKEIYTKTLVFNGGTHDSALSIVGHDKPTNLPEYQKGESHFKNFLMACMGETEARSPFAVSAPLCQIFMLGVIAQRLNIKILFDPSTKQITNNKVANDLLVGPPIRNGWEHYYKV